MLIGARFIQGIGGALTSAVILGMIVTMFPEPREQAKALGVYAFVASAGGSIGLLVGGVLTEAIAWHWIFFINLPIGVATAVMARRLIADRPGLGFGEGADILGGALITAGLMLGVYTILEVSENGWGSTQTLVLGAISLALEAAFVMRQTRIANPLMPLRLFRSRNVSGANALQMLLVAGMFATFFLGALYLQRDPRLQPARGRPRLPADDAGHGRPLARLLRAADHALRAAQRADPRDGAGRRRRCCCSPARRSTATYLSDLLPPLLLIGRRASASPSPR